MSFEIELTNDYTGEQKSIYVKSNDLDCAINLTKEEYPDWTLDFIGEEVGC